MYIVTEPKIYVIGRLRLDWDNLNQYLDDCDRDWEIDVSPDGTRDLELASEFAGRVCYDAFGQAQFRHSNEQYLTNILEQRHGSVLEHASVMLLVTGVSRSLTHELIRHRVGVAYSQRSQRYVSETEAGYVVPPEIVAAIAETKAGADNEADDLFLRWTVAMQSAALAYETLTELLDQRIAQADPSARKREKRIRTKQAARSVLPNAMETTLVFTANLRALRHICELRGGLGAEAEIRRFAVALTRVLQQEAPHIFADMEVAELEDGVEGVRVGHSKV